MKGSGLEKGLAFAFITGIVLTLLGIVIGARAGQLWVRSSYAEHRGGAGQTVAMICLGAIIVGAVLIVGTLIVGLVIACAPGLFAKPRSGRARVVARFVIQDDGTPGFEEVPEGVAAKRCLRLAFDDGMSGDFHCDESAYFRAPEGTHGYVEVKGNRLLSFRVVPAPQVASVRR